VKKALEGAGAVKALRSWVVARKQLLLAMDGAAMFVRSLTGLWFAIRMNSPKMAFGAVACDQPGKSRWSSASGVPGLFRPRSFSTSALSCSLLYNDIDITFRVFFSTRRRVSS
jgi:hypothetical protein